MRFDFKANRLLAALLLTGLLGAGILACNRPSSYDPQLVREKYGLADAYAEQVPTPDGSMRATIVPVTLEDGRRAQLIVPQARSEYPAYFRDQEGLRPVVLEDRTLERDRFVQSRPVAVERQVVPTERVSQKKKRSWQKEVLIVAGSAGAGAGIGAIAGGKKGAAIGAISGGVAGLIYDVATRK